MRSILIRVGICIAVLGWCLFSYLETQNDLTNLKFRLPELEKELGVIREESHRLRYELDQLESPNHLIEMAHRPEHSHLKHPLLKEILTVSDAIATNE
ncbi:MAG TPA: hypothetical protein VGM34_01205 [Chlamydiales bacterium]|jgi:cell division protein FtsB